MDVRVECRSADSWSGGALIVLVTQEDAPPAWLDAPLDGLAGGCSRQSGALSLLPTYGRLPFAWLVVVGLGERDKVTSRTLRQAAAQAAAALAEREVPEAAVLVAATPLPVATAGAALAEGLVLSGYRYDRFRAEPATRSCLAQVTVLVEAADDDWARATAAGVVQGECTGWARDLVNAPSNHLMPLNLAAEATALAKRCGLGARVLEQSDLEAMGCGLILAVNAGSPAPAAMLVLEHRGGAEGETAFGLVGKGVCYDSGGLSLKPSDSMASMKGDMSGAAAVIGAMCAVARLGVARNVTAVVPLVANLVGPASLRPSDVVRGLDGRTVEVLNTDAEGRLILADALTYATRGLGLSPVVDIATLTGACRRALGPVFAGVFGTAPGLVDGLRAAGEAGGERWWPLPLDDGYGELLQSSVADIRNISGISDGGASVAAMFLRSYVGETPWAHLDMAGCGLTDKESPGQSKGATGFGVRTLANLIADGVERAERS